MKKLPKHEYTTEFKEQAVAQVANGGSPRLTQELRRCGFAVGEARVERLM